MFYYILKVVCIIFALISITSCHNKQQKIIGNEISIQDMLDSSINNNTVIVYYNSKGCTPCQLKELWCWEILIKEVIKDSLNIDFIFIIKTSEDNKEIQQIVNLFKFKKYLIFDPEGIFEKRNKAILNDYNNVFLINSENKIISKGNPAYYPDIWKHFKKISKN